MPDPPLPEAELDVMECLWNAGPRTVREIRGLLWKERPLTHASVATLLRRLEAKGFVTHQKAAVGKAFVFRAKVHPVRTIRRLLNRLLDCTMDASGVTLVSTLLTHRPPSEEDLDRLEELIQQHRQKRRS